MDDRIDIPAGASGEIRTTCPECSPGRKKTNEKCLAVNSEKGTWYCHHCGWSGGEGQKTYTVPEYKAETNLPESVLEWFKTRGISETVLFKNQVGYGKSFKDTNGIQFPYFKNGKVVNIKHRTHDKRFRQEKDAEKCFYRFDHANIGSGYLIITEGEIDALSFCEAGETNVVSIPDGAPSSESTNFNSKFDFLRSAEKLLTKYDKVILACDDDGPGKVASKELARRIGIEKCYRVFYPDECKDANDVLVKAGADYLRSMIKLAKPFPIDGIIDPLDLSNEIDALYDSGMNRGMGTGWLKVDEIYTVSPCQMTIITGIPGSGKSNWVDNLILNLAISKGQRFAVFSPENWPPEIHAQTLIEKIVRMPFACDMRNSVRMSKTQAKSALCELNKYVHFIVPKDEEMSIDTILAKTKMLITRHGINGLIIDPWNEVEHNFGGLREDQYLSRELTKIRRFCRTNGIHVWVVAHPKNLSKDENGNYKPPTMYEISGGAHWRNKADNGICVHRPDYENDITEIYVQKIRFKWVGKIGKTDLRYSRESGVYI